MVRASSEHQCKFAGASWILTRSSLWCLACKCSNNAIESFADNWKRPATEVSTLFRLFARYLAREAPLLAAESVRLEVIGRRDRLPAPLADAVAHAEAMTAAGTGLHLRIAIDYSARAAITQGQLLPDVDLLIRTGGEQRLSDFLLWECAYAELVFTPQMWPDFEAADLARALEEFRGRERRFGGLRREAV